MYFSFHTPPPTHIYTLSLHDALPISTASANRRLKSASFSSVSATSSGILASRMRPAARFGHSRSSTPPSGWIGASKRSEEHTSELQSHHDLVCRLLLEKKKINTQNQY